MNALTLAIASARSRRLQSFLCIAAVACGIALLCSVFLLFTAAEGGLKRNAQGIDLVIGAKGSPLQLVLSTVYHNDIPTGNIQMKDVDAIQKNPQIKRAIPLAIGDNYKGWRIIGTTPDYISLYEGKFASGVNFSKPYEAVVGHLTGLKLGDEFAAHHGFSVDSDDVHDFHLYKVTGILKATGTVLDRLIITSYQSVQDLHSHHDDDDEDEETFENQITALLVKVKSPSALMNLPHQINNNLPVMAVAPSHVMAKFMQSTGVGRDVLIVLAYVFLALASLMLLSVLTSGMAERKYDLAVLRVLGASASTLWLTVMAEAVILSAIGAIAGLIFGHVLAFVLISAFPAMQTLALPFSVLVPTAFDGILFVLGIVTGLIASIIPCILVARTDIAGLLAQGR